MPRWRQTARISVLPLSTQASIAFCQRGARFAVAQAGQRDDSCQETAGNLANVGFNLCLSFSFHFTNLNSVS